MSTLIQIAGSGGSNVNSPVIIAASYTDGAVINGIEGVSRSLLVPANTYSGDGLLEILFRVTKTGAVDGSTTLKMYKNTVDSLVGATLIGTGVSASAASIIFFQPYRNARINSNTISLLNTAQANLSDYTFSATGLTSTTFNTAVDNYILFTITLAGAVTSTAVVSFAKLTKHT